MKSAPRPALLLLLAAAVLATGCGRWRLTEVERRRAAWYFEDLAHGLARDHRELITADMSDPMIRLAAFARGAETPGGERHLPEPFGRRRRRWVLLKRALADGRVLVDGEGQLHLAPTMEREVREILEPAVVDENLDRIFGADALLRVGHLRGDSPEADDLIGLIQQAQRHHARDVGGREWSGNSKSSSGSAPTPSTSVPGSWPRPGG